MQPLNQTQFKYGSKLYTFIAKMYMLDDSKSQIDYNLNNVQLTTHNIESFEYVNSANSLYLTGEMIYIDDFGTLDRFIDRPNVSLNILFAENDQEFDGSFAVENLSTKNKFSHSFIVDNIQILDRSGKTIRYKLTLVSANMYKLIRNISFTNYDRDPEEIFDILQSCFSKSGLKIDSDRYKLVKSGVKLNYITNGNDNLMTITKFLMNRLYYFITKDSSIKLICYNESSDMYYLLDVSNQNTFIDADSINLSFFQNNTEVLDKVKMTNFSTVTKHSAIELLKNEFTNKMFNYHINYNSFSRNLEYSTNQILNYANKCPDGLKYKKKYTFSTDDQNYFIRSSIWNNDNDIYNSIVDAMCANNSLIVNTTGSILRKPGYFITLNVDRNSINVSTDDQNEIADLQNKYKVFDGVWISTKVRHIIKPRRSEYTQNIIVCRNFTNKTNIAIDS